MQLLQLKLLLNINDFFNICTEISQWAEDKVCRQIYRMCKTDLYKILQMDHEENAAVFLKSLGRSYIYLPS